MVSILGMAGIQSVAMSETQSDSGRTGDTTVRVSTATRKRLARRGSKGETYEEIITRLLNETEGDGE